MSVSPVLWRACWRSRLHRNNGYTYIGTLADCTNLLGEVGRHMTWPEMTLERAPQDAKPTPHVVAL